MTETVQFDIPAPVQTAPVGFHAIMDCTGVDKLKIKDSTNIQHWVSDVLVKIDATASGSLIITNSGFVGKNGYSVAQLFNHGMLTAHFMEDLGQVYIDVFAWRMFDPTLLENSIKSFFGSTTDVKKILLPRNASVAAPVL